MHKRNTTYSGNLPKKIISQKVKLINPNSSPTPSPIKKVRHFYSDKYLVTNSENITIKRNDTHSFVNGNSSTSISPTSMHPIFEINKNLFINTDLPEYKTPIVNFVPKRPKKFVP